MNPSAELCRAQQAIERARAESSPLANVRVIAERSAAAWGKEAVFADKREARREQTRLAAEPLAEDAGPCPSGETPPGA